MTNIIFENDNPIFRQPNGFRDVKRVLVQTWTIQLLEFNLVKMSRGEYVSISQLKGYEIHIIFEDDNPIFKRPNRFSDVKKALVQTWTI